MPRFTRDDESLTAKEYSLTGVIIDAGRFSYNTDRRIVIQTIKGNKYICMVPSYIFSNFQVEDIIECKVSPDEKDGRKKQTYTMNSKPFTQFPVDEGAIQRCFIRALSGTGFGGVSAERLYKEIKDIAKICGYTPVNDLLYEGITTKPESRDEQDIGPDPDEDESDEGDDEKHEEKQSFPGIPKSTSKVILTEEVVGTDGVITLLTEMAARFIKSQDVGTVETLVGCGLKKKQAEILLRWWHKSRSMRRLHLLGFTNKQIDSCRMNCDEIYQTIVNNPYKLAPISMEMCAEIMTIFNQKPTNAQLKCGEIVRKIYEYVENRAYACVPLKTMEWNFPHFCKYLGELTEDYDIILDGRNIYQKYNHEVEIYMANLIDDLSRRTAEIYNSADPDSITTANFKLKTLTEEQKQAITGCINNRISIITGGGGVGKSTICQEIYRNFELRGARVAACSFTGKAVSRLNHCLGTKMAQTMDLMIRRAGSIPQFDVLIMDEASMVTTELAYRFKQAFPFDFIWISVGDCDQLPPISWGFFMRQLMKSERVPIYNLTKNQRMVKHTMTAEEEEDFEEESKGKDPASMEYERTLLENCEYLKDSNRNLSEPMELKEGNGCYFLDGDQNSIKDMLEQLKGVFTKDQIQVICPFNKYIDQINEFFQDVFLANAKTVVDRKGRRWKVGDRIMMTRNNYTINIMNGEEGHIMDLTERGVKVKFANGAEHLFLYVTEKDEPEWGHKGDGDGDYGGDELLCDMIKLSFCITVHKAQGDGFEAVILFVPTHLNKKGNLLNFLNINLLYTSWTRTIRVIWTIGKAETIQQMTMNKMALRVDNLAGRLYKMKDEELQAKMEHLVEYNPVNPFIAINAEKKAKATGKPVEAIVEDAGYNSDYCDDDIWD
jgi:hypothetical protein